MNAQVGSLVLDIEVAIQSGDAERRREMLRKVTGLFMGEALRLREEQVAAFDAVILRLAHDIETKARLELSTELADVANAPRRVIHDLALDPAIEVAGPVLERSIRVSEDDLVQVAERRDQQYLMALTRRSTLTERVTDVLVVRGDRDVVRSVARNDGAVFSERGHSTLVSRAASDPELQSTLQTRTDIPPAFRKRLVELAQQRAERTLNAEFGEASAGFVRKAAGRLKSLARDDALLAAEVAVSSQTRRGDLDEGAITTWLQNGQETEALVALARLAGVPNALTIKAFEAESYEPLLFLVRSVKFGWRILKLFMTAKAGKAPSPEEMQGAMEAFQALSVTTAQRIVRFSSTRDYTETSTPTAF